MCLSVSTRHPLQITGTSLINCDMRPSLPDCHKMDGEEIMGMFSAAKHKATNATVCYLSCKMRPLKTGTVDFLDRLEKTKRDELLMKVVHLGQQQRRRKRKKQIELGEELSKRQAKQQQARDTSVSKKLEKKLKTVQIAQIGEEFPELSVISWISYRSCCKVNLLVSTFFVCFWVEDRRRILYTGRIEKMKAKGSTCVVAYWSQTEMYSDATDYDMSVFELAADLISDALAM